MLESLVKCRSKRQSQEYVGAWVINLSIHPKLVEVFSIGVDGGLRDDLHLYMPQDEEVRQRLLDEAHHSKYTIHLRSTKMYKDLKRNFW